MASELRRALERLDDAPLWKWDDDAPELIRRGLASDVTGERLIAVGLAAEVMDDEIAHAILKMVTSDPDEEVAGRAAVALGPALETCDVEGFDLFPDDLAISESVFKAIIRELETAYRDASVATLARRRALEAAVRAPREWQRDAVRAALHSDDGGWQTTAVFCMGFLEGFEAEIVAALESSNPHVRFEAVRAAGRQEVEEAEATVFTLAAADGTDRELRLAAIGALASLSPEGADELLAQLARSADEEVAETAEATIEERELFAGPLPDELGGELEDFDGGEDDLDDYADDEDYPDDEEGDV